jgi:predicted PhzF superfamily epimerase YddE/YHI9
VRRGRRPHVAAKLGDEHVRWRARGPRRVGGRDGVEEVARVGEAVGAQRPDLGQLQRRRGKHLEDVAARGARDVDAEAHAARHDGDLARRDGQRLAFAAPPLIRSGPAEAETVATIARGIGVEPAAIKAAQWADNGPGWVAAMLSSRVQLLALKPDYSKLGGLKLGVVAPWDPKSDGADVQFEVRALVSGSPPKEDPVTGSLNAAVAQAMIAKGLASAPYVAAQGECLGRTGRIFIDQDAAGRIWVGGRTETLFLGTMTGAKSA